MKFKFLNESSEVLWLSSDREDEPYNAYGNNTIKKLFYPGLKKALKNVSDPKEMKEIINEYYKGDGGFGYEGTQIFNGCNFLRFDCYIGHFTLWYCKKF